MNITLMRTEDGEVLLQGTYSTLRMRQTGGGVTIHTVYSTWVLRTERCYYIYKRELYH